MKYLSTMLLLLLTSCSIYDDVFNKPLSIKLNWHEIINLKDINNDYVPQGIAFYKDYMIFSIHEKDRRSKILFFNVNTSSPRLLFSLDMPPEATHTSDLEIYRNKLFALDYTSNKLYEINLEKTIKSQMLSIDNTYALNISRSGSFAFVSHNDANYLLVSQFILSNDLYVIKLPSLFLNKKIIQKGKKIKAERFIQGLFSSSDNNVLLVSVNKQGKDLIYLVDRDKMMSKHSLHNSILKTYDAPGRMIEDIAIVGNYIYTSDEETFKIYRALIK